MREDLLKRHLELVIEANKTTNITRISTWDEGMLLHVQDSLVGLPELREAPEGRMVDDEPPEYQKQCHSHGDKSGNGTYQKLYGQ